jgi:hypothetical protein
MGGFTPGQKVFKTTDRGVNWTNISGDLPNVPMADLVVHPDDDGRLYLGTEFGCYRTTDEGATWERWNNGMPEATIITEMSYFDRRSIDGNFMEIASSYGRGMWARAVLGVPLDVAESPAPPAPIISGLKNYPNPFSGQTTVSFALSRPMTVDLQVVDVTGRTVARLLQGPATAGSHSQPFDASKLAPGIYFCRLRAGGVESTQKLVVTR